MLIADWRGKSIVEIENNLNACGQYFPRWLLWHKRFNKVYFDSCWVKEKTNKHQTATKPPPSNIGVSNSNNQIPVENTELKLTSKMCLLKVSKKLQLEDERELPISVQCFCGDIHTIWSLKKYLSIYFNKAEGSCNYTAKFFIVSSIERSHAYMNLFKPAFKKSSKPNWFSEQHNIEQTHTILVSRGRVAQRDNFVFME